MADPPFWDFEGQCYHSSWLGLLPIFYHIFVSVIGIYWGSDMSIQASLLSLIPSYLLKIGEVPGITATMLGSLARWVWYYLCSNNLKRYSRLFIDFTEHIISTDSSTIIFLPTQAGSWCIISDIAGCGGAKFFRPCRERSFPSLRCYIRSYESVIHVKAQPEYWQILRV